MQYRHLDYEPDTPVSELGTAALDALLEQGDLDAWTPLARAIRKDPNGEVASTVLRLCESHQMYGSSALWARWIAHLRVADRPRAALSLRGLRRARGRTQEQIGEVMGISQSDVSKLERRGDLRLSTLHSYVRAFDPGETCLECWRRLLRPRMRMWMKGSPIGVCQL